MRRKLAGFAALFALLSAMGLPSACGTSTSSPDATDTDGDGLSDRDELMIYGTSPLLADTDGDGWSDYAEVIDFGFDPVHAPYRFNPRIADLPELAIVFTSPPLLTIQMTDSTGETWTVTTTQTSENSLSVTTSVTTTDTRSDTISTPTTVTDTEQVSETIIVSPADIDDEEEEPPDAGNDEDKKDAGKDDDAGDAGHEQGVDHGDKDKGNRGRAELDVTRELTITRTRSVSESFEPSTTVEASIALTEEQTNQYSEALSLAESYARSHDVTAISGVLLITGTIENRGHVAFRIINLLLSATMLNAPPAYTPVGNLTIDAEPYSDFQPFSLAPGEVTAPINFIRLGLTLEAAQAIFSEAQTLLVQLGLFEIDDATGRAFSFTIGETTTKTALIWIDYGERRPAEWHQVATKADPTRTSITLRKAFEDVMRIPFDASRAGLLSVRGIGASNSSGGYWALALDHDDGSGIITTRYYDPSLGPYGFDDIELYAGDVLRLAYMGP